MKCFIKKKGRLIDIIYIVNKEGVDQKGVIVFVIRNNYIYQSIGRYTVRVLGSVFLVL